MTSLRAVTPLLAQRFRVGRPLGIGGSGIVYEAFDERDQITVALKAIPLATPETIARVRREVDSLRGISHPNLLRLGELFVEGNTAFLSMELVSGPNFLEYVRSACDANGQKTFDEARLRQALSQLSSGLLSLHAEGRVHRDVKPENVLVTHDHRVVLVDFGLMSEADAEQDSQSTEAVGTALYMAPEQAAGKPVGSEADWYSVGVMLYEALCGRLPFAGSSLEVLIEKQRSDPEPVRQREPRAPEDLSELCAQLLRFEPTKRPSGRAVLRRLSGPAPFGELGARSTHSLLSSLRGRQAEFEAFDQALSEVRARRTVVIELRGEPGSGKTRLMTALCSHALEQGARVAFGRVLPTAAYNALHAVIEPIAAMLRAEAHPAPQLSHGDLLRRIFVALEDVPELGGSEKTHDPQQLRANMFAAVRALLTRLSAQKVLVIALDDFDEVDADSLSLLTEVLRPPDAPPVLLLVSATVDRGASIWARDDLRRLTLGRLESHDASELARDLTQITGQAERSVAILSRARGCPLLIEELVRLAAAGGDPDDIRSLADVCRERAERLPPLARRTAEFLAQSPAPLGLDVLAQVVGTSATEISRLASLLVLLGFAHASHDSRGETLALSHGLFRAPLIAALDGEELTRRHLALARALELSSHGAAPEILAFHYSCAAADKLAAARALEAAEGAEKALAFERAARLFALAQKHLPDRSQELRAARVREGRALSWAGLGVRSADAFVAARIGANAAEALDLGQRAAQQLLFAGRIKEGEALLRSTLASEAITYPATPLRAFFLWLLDLVRLKLRGLRFRPKDSSTLPSHVLMRIDACFHASMMLVVSDSVRSHFFALRSLLDALKAGQAYRVTRALAIHAGVVSAAGGRSEAKSEALFEAADQLVKDAGSPPHGRAIVLAARGQARFLAGRFSDSLSWTARAEHIFRNECSEVPWELNVVRLWGARSLQYMGQYRELAGRVPMLLEECRQRGDLYGEVSILLSVHAHLLLVQDKPHDALRGVLEGQRRWQAEGFHVQHYHGLISRVSIALYEGNPREAYERANEALSGGARSLLGRIQFVRVVTHAACGISALSLARTQSDGRELRQRAREHAKRLLAERVAWAVPQGELLVASLALHEGQRHVGLSLLRRAAQGFDAAKMTFHAASTRLHLGQLLADSEGDTLVREAEAHLTDQGVLKPASLARTLVPSMDDPTGHERTRIRPRFR